MAEARVQTTDGAYRIAVGEDVSAEFDFGEVAEWEAPGGKRYLALVDLPDGGDESDEVETKFEYWLYEVTPIDSEPEELENFDDEAEGEPEQDPG